ncbi:MAG: hypothetical protein WCB04_14305 [Mycobacteriales bacterium]
MRSEVRAVWRDLIGAGTLAGGVGAVAVGISGVLAEIFGATFGQAFVSGDPPGVTYTAARCAEFLEYAPRSRDCAAAATTHHFGEVVQYRIGLGVMGLFALLLWWLLRRRIAGPRVLPEAFVPTVLSALFGVAALGLLAQAAGLGLGSGSSAGIGDALSGGLIAGVAGVVSVLVLYRALLARAARVADGTGRSSARA